MCDPFKRVRSLGDIRSLGQSVTFDAEITCLLASDQSNSEFPESPARFPQEYYS